jgi:flagellar biosynthesis protein FlhB
MSEATEEASPQRIRQARERGQVATSRDAVGTASILAGLAAMWVTRDSVVVAFRTPLAPAIHAASTPGTAPVAGALEQAASLALGSIVPPLVAAVAAAALVGALLTGFLIAPAAALPSLERLNPFESLKRYGKPRTYVEPAIQFG